MKKYILVLYKETDTYTFVFTAKNDNEADDKATKETIEWETDKYDLFSVNQMDYNHKKPFLIVPITSNLGCSVEEAKSWLKGKWR